MNHKSGNPLVSVIMTVYNGEKYVKEALQSIVDQTCPEKEIIVIDDGSTDNTVGIVTEFSNDLIYEYTEHAGIAAGWNRGVQKATGAYLSFLDADDLWPPHKLQKQVSFFRENPGVDIVFGYAREFSSPELSTTKTDSQKRKQQDIPGISAGTMMIEREKFLEIGLFDSKWRKGIFSDWYLRATERKVSVYMDRDIFLHRRIHDTNHGKVQRDKYVDYVRMLKASIDRKRQS